MWRAILLLSVATLSAKDRIAFIDFYGSKGIDIAPIRATLPAKEGDPYVESETHRAFERSVLRTTGRPATEVATVCCDPNGDTYIFIGLPGESYRTFATNPRPSGTVRLSREMLALNQRLDAAFEALFEKGGNALTEDDSNGYALSNDPPMKVLQMELRAYALAHEDEIYGVTENSADASQRQIAATALGYGAQSPRQIAALVHASRDPNGEVRNAATRALGVLLSANRALVAQVPLEPYVEMLSSGIWTDRNKGCFVVDPMTRARDPKLLAHLRAEALDPLIDMARWRSPGHSSCAKGVLARIAGAREEDVPALSFGPAQAVLDLLKVAH